MEAYGKIVNHVAVINTENRILYIYIPIDIHTQAISAKKVHSRIATYKTS